MALFPVILSGGSGTRLWPVSRERVPKQFMALQGHGGDTLLGATLKRLGPDFDSAPPTILCNADHRFLVAEELDRAGLTARSIILEPSARNTGPAITLAALSVLRDDPDGILIVMPSDHAIEDLAAFRSAICDACRVAADSRLVLFGIPPRHPHTGYGYIRRGNALGGTSVRAFAVDGFFEKPDEETASGYLRSGDYLWNSGLFVLNARTFLDEVGRLRPAILSACQKALAGCYADLGFLRLKTDAFIECPAISVDYAVMEHTDKAVLIDLDAGWSDVGSWSALWDLGTSDDQGNVVEGRAVLQDTANTYIRSDRSLVATLGIRDAVVVDTPDALLVASRDQAESLRDLVAAIKAEGHGEHAEHRRHHRPWGTFDVLNEGPGFKVKLITVKPGAMLSLQRHQRRSEHWVVVSGVAEVTHGDARETVAVDGSVSIPVGAWHRLSNPGPGPLRIVEVQIGGYLQEDDIERAGDVYNRAASET
ncbi:MAG: mannose-1-phosphate guanylyltransferase/mannose-6-phosphate isomerase [Pseudomonadota bacterium]